MENKDFQDKDQIQEEIFKKLNIDYNNSVNVNVGDFENGTIEQKHADLFKQFNIKYDVNKVDNVDNVDNNDDNGNLSDEEEYVSDEEYTVAVNEIDINDYVLADEYVGAAEHEFKNDINIINILTLHYKQHFNITEKITIFDGIKEEDDTATNKCMEFVYGEIFRYDKSDMEDKSVLYDPNNELDLNNYSELYCLIINDEPIYVCPFTLPLASHLAKLEWLNIEWNIINII